MGRKQDKKKKTQSRSEEDDYNSWDEYESEVEEEIEPRSGDENDDFMGQRVNVGRFFNEDASEGTGSDVNSSGNDSDGSDSGNEIQKKRKVLGKPRERKWTAASSKQIKTCRHFSYSLIECAWRFRWEPHQIADLIALVIDELELDNDAIARLLESTNSVDIETVAALIDAGVQFTPEELLNVIQSGTADPIKFCKMIGETLEHGLLSLRHEETLESICKLPVEKNFHFSAVSCLCSMLVEHAASKPLFGRCFALATEHMTPMDIATIGIKIVGSHVFRELKGSLNSFLDAVQTGRAELEVQINKQFHRDQSGEIMESDEDSEGNLR